VVVAAKGAAASEEEDLAMEVGCAAKQEGATPQEAATPEADPAMEELGWAAAALGADDTRRRSHDVAAPVEIESRC
jgi:hypothetical protein